MSNRKKESYAAVYKYIDENLLGMVCKSFMTDYEVAMSDEFKKVTNDGRATHCFFHACQAVKRNGAKIPGFSHYLRSNPHAERIYYKLMSLPLLPADKIRVAFQQLKNQAPKEPCFIRFLIYFERQWIQGSRVRISFEICHY